MKMDPLDNCWFCKGTGYLNAKPCMCNYHNDQSLKVKTREMIIVQCAPESPNAESKLLEALRKPSS